MKNIVSLFVLTLFALTPFVRAEEEVKAEDPKALKEKFSTAIGISMAENLKQVQDDVDIDIIVKTMKEVLGGAKPSMNDQELQKVFAQAQEAKQAAGKKEGENFLVTNGKKEGITTTASGLQYEVLKKGEGAKPAKTDTVVTHYKGTFINGKQFDSSYDRNEPAEFPVTGVIAGWTEALQLMPVGSKWKLYIPSALAYGPGGRPGIPPNSVLVFELELISIKGAK
jgi:FKBP-type peptidyl-prolyl cis-trans isomerase